MTDNIERGDDELEQDSEEKPMTEKEVRIAGLKEEREHLQRTRRRMNAKQQDAHETYLKLRTAVQVLDEEIRGLNIQIRKEGE